MKLFSIHVAAIIALSTSGCLCAENDTNLTFVSPQGLSDETILAASLDNLSKIKGYKAKIWRKAHGLLMKEDDEDDSGSEHDDEDIELVPDSKLGPVVDKLLVKTFVSLKESGLINDIIRFSLTDDKVRSQVVNITIELLEAGVIPWEDVFEALNTSGLAIDVVMASVTDAATRSGIVNLVKELLPQLVQSGEIDIKQVLQQN